MSAFPASAKIIIIGGFVVVSSTIPRIIILYINCGNTYLIIRIDKLKSDYPDLTKNDLRLCALYLINIPPKEVAEIMGVSPSSIKMARYRLRKKLSIKPNEDLNNYLVKINKEICFCDDEGK